MRLQHGQRSRFSFRRSQPPGAEQRQGYGWAAGTMRWKWMDATSHTPTGAVSPLLNRMYGAVSGRLVATGHRARPYRIRNAAAPWCRTTPLPNRRSWSLRLSPGTSVT